MASSSVAGNESDEMIVTATRELVMSTIQSVPKPSEVETAFKRVIVLPIQARVLKGGDPTLCSIHLAESGKWSKTFG